MTVPLTKEIGAFIAGMDATAIPDEAIAIVRNGFTDYAATTILGRDAPVVRILKSMAAVVPGGGEARICFSADGAPAAEAALINGAAGHAFDYDDIGMGVHPAHPSVALCPAILAEAEVLGATGKDMIAAYVAGYEVWGELGRRDRKAHTIKGWHPTGVFGAVAAAAAVARLRGLDAERSAHAVGIGASQAAGLVANFGSMTKPFHAGRASQVGLMSARLAEAGMTASPNVIEAPQGFLNAVSPAGEVDLESPPILGQWWILKHGLGFKLYPVCYGAHRALDGMLDLIAENPFDPEDVAEVEMEIGPAQAANLSKHDPKDALDAKFCGEFAMAMAMIARRASMAEVSNAFVKRDDVRALMKKVRLSVIRGEGEDKPDTPPDDHVIVTLKDGRRLVRKLDFPRGHPTKPVSADVLWTKFADCVAGAMPDGRAGDLFDALQALDTLNAVSDLPRIEPAMRQAS